MARLPFRAARRSANRQVLGGRLTFMLLVVMVTACSTEPSTTGGSLSGRTGQPSTTTTPEPSNAVTSSTASTPGTDPPPLGPGGATPDSEPRPTPSPPPSVPGGRWIPRPGTTWQWQLSGRIETSVDAEVFDVDLDVPEGVLADLKARGRRVICYVSVGAWEDFRGDAAAFPEDVLGEPNGWPGERWVDIRRLDVLGPIIERRLDRCAARGFDAVEPDNVDGYANETGFPLTYADQVRFNRFISEAARARGLSVGLKNDLEQAADLEPYFDFAVNEECVAYGECHLLAPFVVGGKSVFHAEYSVSVDEMCRATSGLGFSSLRKAPDLGASFERCS